MRRQLVALTCLIANSAFAQPSGVLLHDNGGNAFRGGIAISNPEGAAPHTVSITPSLNGDVGIFADSLFGEPLNGFRSSHASMSPTGRVAFQADWIRFDYGITGPLIYAQDRDGTNRVLLSDTSAVSRGETPVGAVSDFLPSISPDGETVAFISTRFRGENLDGSPNTTDRNIMQVSASGGAVTPITSSEIILIGGREFLCAGFSQVAWSPDGTRLAFIGSRPARDAEGNLTASGCVASLGVMNADGSGEVILRRGGFAAETPYTPTGFVLSWTRGGILYHDSRQNTLEVMTPDGSTIRQIPVPTQIGGYVVSLSYGWALSPDGQHLATSETNGSILVADLDLNLVERIETFTGGPRFMQWADASPTPEPARIELASDPRLLWSGVQATLQPTLYDATNEVIVVGARSWSGDGANASTPRLGRLSGIQYGNGSNTLAREICAANGGLTACATFDNVHTPIVTAEVLDAEAAEADRDPGRVRIQRYGNPTPEVDVVLGFAGSAQFFRDYTATESGPLLRLGAGDTTRVAEVVIIPVDDGLAEGDEAVILNVQCPQGSGCTVPGNVTYATVLITSNGAGSGVGIASSRPEVGQAGTLVTLTVNGQGFEEGTTATLVGPASVEASAVFVRREGALLYAQFNLDEAPLGTYALTVTSRGSEATLDGALRVVDGGSAEPWVAMLPNSHLTGFPSGQRVVYGNRGTTDAYMVPVFIAVGADAQVEMRSKVIVPPGVAPDLASAIEPYLVPDSLFTFVEQCVPPLGGQSARRATSEVGCATMTSMKVGVFVIPVIPAGGSGTLDFSITTGTLGNVPMGVAISPVGLVETSEARLGSVECASADASRLGRPPENPDLAQVGSSCLGCILSLAGVALEFVPGAPCLEAGLLAAAGITNNVLGAGLSGFDDLSVSIAGSGSIVGALGAMAECAGSFFPAAKLAQAAAEAISAVAKVAAVGIGGAGTIIGCVDCAKKAFWKYYFSFWSRSIDPNIKLGPTGVGEAGYVPALASAPYQILFENLPEATASAREVTVVDTLDTEVFDLSTFQLGPISIPDTTIVPPPGVQSWTTYVDRRPEKPSLLRFDAHLDPETGVARWVISDLDPNTFGYREDAGAGFLPPNVTAPEGEGSVGFLVEPLDGLGDGRGLRNRASIRFDREAWIRTPLWINTLDFASPTSTVTAVAANTAVSDTSYTITVSGTDGGSGVQRTALYASVEGGPFELVAVTDLGSDGEVPFEAERERSYGFFALAVDWTGNEEALKTEAEATLNGLVANEVGMLVPQAVELATPYPNPTGTAAVIQFGLPSSTHVDVRIYDLQGREVARVVESERDAGWHREAWDASALAPGVYVIRLMADGVADTQRVTVVR